MKFFALSLLFVFLGMMNQALAHNHSENQYSSARYDLMYLPEQGTVFGTTKIEHRIQTLELADAKTKANSNVVTQTIGYSLLNNLSFEVGMSYVANQKYSVGTSAGKSSFFNDGAGDPTAQLRFRILDSRFTVDFTAGGALSVKDRKPEEFGIRAGGHIVTAGFDVGMRRDDTQYKLSLNATSVFEAETDLPGNSKLTTESYQLYDFTVTRLAQLSEELFTAAHLGIGWTTPIREKETESLIGTATRYTAGADLRYLLSHNMVVRPGAQYTTSSGYVKNDDWTFYAALDYQTGSRTGRPSLPARDTGSQRYDLMYLPGQGTLFGSTDFSYALTNFDTDLSGVDISSKMMLISQEVGYSLSDRLAVGARIGFSPSLKYEANFEGGKITESNSGINDPSVFAKYRWIDDAYIVDLRAEGQIALDDAKLDEVGLRTGGHQVGLGLDAGIKNDRSQHALSFDLAYALEETFKNANGTEAFKNDAYFLYGLRFARLSRLTNTMHLNTYAGFSGTSRVKTKGVEGDTGVSASGFNVGTDLRVLMSDRMVIRPSVDYGVAQAGADAKTWTMGLGVDYQF